MSCSDEKTKWNLVYGQRLQEYDKQSSVFSSDWWRHHYEGISAIGTSYLDPSRPLKVLETGCGTGRNSLLLKHPSLNITFVDIANNALLMAEKTAIKLKTKHRLNFREANLLSLPFKDSIFDLTWNVGALEHYSKKEISKAIKEMLRVTKKDGHIIIGFPNPKSLAYKKAALLGKSKFKAVTKMFKGYRNDTEKAYSPHDISTIVKTINPTLAINIVYTSNLTFVETPQFINKLIQPLEGLFPKYRFLYLIIIEK